MERAIAHVTDGFILSLFTILFLAVTSFLFTLIYEIAYEIGIQASWWLDAVSILIMLSAMVVNLGYYTFCHARWGQTPGKKIMGIELVGIDGGRIGWGRALWRIIAFNLTITFGASFCLLIFPYIIPFLNEDRRAVHDYLSATIVVRK